MNRPSIYALFKDEEIVYIGQSINAYSRIGSHNKDKDFDYFRLMPCLKHRMNHWEEMLIQRYQPRYNKAGLKKSFKPMYRKSNTQQDTIQNNRVVDMRDHGAGITFRSNTSNVALVDFHTSSSGASRFIDSGQGYYFPAEMVLSSDENKPKPIPKFEDLPSADFDIDKFFDGVKRTNMINQLSEQSIMRRERVKARYERELNSVRGQS